MQHPEIIRAGVIQFDVQRGDIAKNLATAEDALHRLKQQDTQLAVLPELWTCGFDHANIKEHALKTTKIIETLSQAAKKQGMVIAGSLPELVDGRIYNTLAVIDTDGSISGKYQKVHLFSGGRESMTFSAGQKAEVWHTSLGPIGGIICYDIRFPELCRSLAIQGARIIVVCAQWPEPRINHWDTLIQARAIENQLFMVAANRTGSDGGQDFPGHSQIVSPFGKILAKTDKIKDQVSADLHFKEMDDFRGLFDCLKERMPEAY
jgi:predicted amidohydrolase